MSSRQMFEAEQIEGIIARGIFKLNLEINFINIDFLFFTTKKLRGTGHGNQ